MHYGWRRFYEDFTYLPTYYYLLTFLLLLTTTYLDASVLLSHDLEDTDARVARQPISFGDYVTANVFFPAAAPAAAAAPPLPAVVWLHPYSYATGYTPAYGMSNVVEELVLDSSLGTEFHHDPGSPDLHI